MIDNNHNPIEWALLLSEIDEASEHLEEMLKEMAGTGEIEDSEFAVQLGHVFAHLNRAWHTRNLEQEASEDDWVKHSRFPSDLEPVG